MSTMSLENLQKTIVFTPLKAGKYSCKIESVGINEEPTGLKGFYKKEQPEGKNNNYIRLDLVTAEGKKINKNVFPEGLNITISNIKRQLGIEEDMDVISVLKECLKAKTPNLEMWVWYNAGNKNVDFYDAITAQEMKAQAEAEAQATADAFLNGVER